VAILGLFKSLSHDQRNTVHRLFSRMDAGCVTFVIVPMAHDFGTSIADSL